MKLKRILVQEGEQEIYGEIDTVANEGLINSQLRVLPNSVQQVLREENCEIITPDDGHSYPFFDAGLSNKHNEISTCSRNGLNPFAQRTSIQETTHSRPALFPQSIQMSSFLEQIKSTTDEKEATPSDQEEPSFPKISSIPGELEGSVENVVTIKEEPVEYNEDFPVEDEICGKEAPDENQGTPTICVEIPVNEEVPHVIKQEPLDLMDDDHVMEHDSLIQDDFDEQLPVEVKLERTYDEDENYGFSECEKNEEYDEVLYYGNEDDEVIDSKDDVFDPLVVKDENDFYRNHSILGACMDDDPGNKSDYSYRPSGDEEDDFYEKKPKITRPLKSSPKRRLKTSFNCKICGKKSKWIKTHINHMREKHPNDPYVKDKLNLDKAKLIESKEEMKTMGIPMRRTQCPICSRKGFKGFVSYNDHINGHKNIRSYICGCGSAFTTRHNFVAHRKLCKVPFNECQLPKYAEDSFFEGASRKPDPPLRDRVCPVCGKTGFQLMINFMDHQNKHSEEKPYKCGRCAFNTSTLFRFTQHLKKYGCPFEYTEWPDYAENYRKNKEDKLKVFGNLKQPGRPVKKEQEDYSGAFELEAQSPTLPDFSEAMDVEEPEPANDLENDESLTEKRPVLGDRTRVRNNRNFPIPDRIIHEGKKFYTCWECDFKSVKTTLVYNHYESRHTERNIECPECKKMFPSERILKKHERQMHQEMVKCDECDDVVPRIRMKRHKDYKHLRPFACKECDASFGRPESLTSHVTRAHRKNTNPNIVTCVLCEKQVNLKIQSFQSHIAGAQHWIYESRWLEFNCIAQIPCKICKNWKTRCIETLFKHMYDVHNMGEVKCSAYLSTFGSQDPRLLEAMNKKSATSVKEEESKPAEAFKIERRVPPKSTINELVSKIERRFQEESKPTEVFKVERSVPPKSEKESEKTCFVCFKEIPMVDKSTDKNIMHHINSSHNHHVNETEWLSLHGLQHFPCPDCELQSANTLQAAIYHSRKKHGDSVNNYFEFLRAKFAPSAESGEKSQCFICLKKVLNMREHINSSLHMLYEKKWSKMKDVSQFPCSCCETVNMSIREAGLHAVEAHNQSFVEYLQFIEILFKPKGFLRQENEDKDNEVTFGVEYVPKDPYKDLVVPFDYFVNNPF